MVLDYLSLAKPRIIPLLLITALGGMMIAERGWPSTGLVVLTLLGGALAAAGAGAINCWIDRDLDREMLRTRRRPLPDGRIAPTHALIFGIGLGLGAFLLLAFTVDVLAATLALSGLLFYVFVYTLWLKRWTVQNIVIGGAAGAVPPMVGWAAVTHRLDLTALYLFAIIFLWTPPHFWALALRLKGDYARRVSGAPSDPLLHAGPGYGHAGRGADRRARPHLPGRRRPPGWAVHRAGRRQSARPPPAMVPSAFRLFDRVSRAVVRGDGGRSDDWEGIVSCGPCIEKRRARIFDLGCCCLSPRSSCWGSPSPGRSSTTTSADGRA